MNETKTIFLSYRRDDSQHLAGRLCDRLAERFGEQNIFMDVDSIEPGLDFANVIERAVGSCDILIALIGKKWLDNRDGDGRRRLDDPKDFVRLEIGAALSRGIRVIPVLVDGAIVPTSMDLPRPLVGLVRRNAVRLDHETFRTDIIALLRVLDRALEAPGTVGPKLGHAEQMPGDTALEWRHTSKLSVMLTIEEQAQTSCLAFRPDGRRIAVGGFWGFSVWEIQSDLARPVLRIALPHRLDGVSDVVFSPDGARLATAPETRKLAYIWDANTGRELMRIPHSGLMPLVSSVAFSPDGNLLATSSFANNVARVWDLGTGKEVTKVRHKSGVLKGGIYAVAFSPDGTRFATASDDKSARVWDVATGGELARLSHNGDVMAVSFSGNSKQIATAGNDKVVKVWDSATGDLVKSLAHDSGVKSLTFHRSGSLLATITKAGTALRIWNLLNGEQCAGVSNYEHKLRMVRFSPDGTRLATASGAGVQVWAPGSSDARAEVQT